MRSRPANVSLIHRRCSGRSAAPGREEHHSTEPHPLTFCSMSELLSAKVWIIPGLGRYDAGVATRLKLFFSRAAKQGGTVEKQPELGPLGAVLSIGGAHPSVTSYEQKDGWAFGFQGEKGVTKAQVLALARHAYRRL